MLDAKEPPLGGGYTECLMLRGPLLGWGYQRILGAKVPVLWQSVL